jgi:hypothetical protein
VPEAEVNEITAIIDFSVITHGSWRSFIDHFCLSSMAQFPYLGKALLRPDCRVQLHINIVNIRHPVQEICMSCAQPSGFIYIGLAGLVQIETLWP